MNAPRGWGGDDSVELDKAIRAERTKDKRLYTSPAWKALGNGAPQLCTAEELKRRKAAERALKGDQPSNPTDQPTSGRWPTPRQNANGRWTAKCIHNGESHQGTFETRQEAEQWIREIKEQS